MKRFSLLALILSLSLTAFDGSSFAESKKTFGKRSESSKHSERDIGRVFSRESNSIPFYYARSSIIINRKSLPPLQDLPWQEQPTPQDPAIVFDVEVRDGMSMYNQKGWFNLSSYSEQTGVMLAFGEPTIQPIINSAQYAPVDILFIDKQGKITQIVPNILLSELDQDIYPNSEILAFLFLKGGSCANLSIHAGDDVQYSLFKKPPLILNAPQEPQANTINMEQKP